MGSIVVGRPRRAVWTAGVVVVVRVGETAGEGGKMILAGVATFTCAVGEVGTGDDFVDNVFQLVTDQLVDVEIGKRGVGAVSVLGAVVKTSGCTAVADLVFTGDFEIVAVDDRACAEGLITTNVPVGAYCTPFRNYLICLVVR